MRAIVVLLGWRHRKFNICHLSLLRLVVMERYTKERRVVTVKTRYKYGEIMWKQFAKFVEFSIDEMHHTSQQFKE